MTSDEFASLVTHELRNPLNALSGWLHLLSADPTLRPEAAQRALAGMRRALEQQVAQIDTLGQVLKLSMPSDARPDRPPIRLDGVVADSTDALRPAAQAAGREIVVLVDDRVRDLRVRGDRTAFGVVLQSLGRYAMRHGMPSAPLRFELSAGDGGGPLLRLSVDEGDGNGRSIWSVFGADGGTRLPLDLLHAALELESHGARIGPQGDGRVGDALEIRFSPHDGSATARTESGSRA
jgi:signal transduction histidine kinase